MVIIISIIIIAIFIVMIMNIYIYIYIYIYIRGSCRMFPLIPACACMNTIVHTPLC